MKQPFSVKESIIRLIRLHGLSEVLFGLTNALEDISPDFLNVIEIIDNVKLPESSDDFRGAARCGECPSCQEFLLTPDQVGGCTRRYANSNTKS